MKRQHGEAGAAVAWLMVTLPVLLLFLGMVLDLGFLLFRSQQLDAATDAAALAATDAWDRDEWLQHGKVRIDRSDAEAIARAYLAKNLPEARLDQVTVAPANRVNIHTRMEVPHFFMGVVGLREGMATSFSTAVRRDAN